ncbi:MAG: hypothetical protein FIA89_00845 [Geobacter sp.]|nr:hypothetical protein [Geobacter sp.]
MFANAFLAASTCWFIYLVLYNITSTNKLNVDNIYLLISKNKKQITLNKVSRSFYWGFFHAFLYLFSLPIFALRYGKKFTLRLFVIEYVFTFLIAIIIEFIFFKAINFSYVTYIIYFLMITIFTAYMALSISKKDAKYRIECLITRGWSVLAEIPAASKKEALEKYRQLSVTSLDVQIIDKAG